MVSCIKNVLQSFCLHQNLCAYEKPIDEKNIVDQVEKEREMADAGAIGLDERIKQLFFEKVPKLSKPYYEKAMREIKQSKALQNRLSPELCRLRKEKQEKLELARDPDHKLERKVAKMLLAHKLGCSFEESSKGTTGSQIACSVSGKKVGLFKPSQSSRSFFMCLWRYFKSLMGGQSYFLSPDKNACSAAEVAAYKTKKLGFEHLNVPPAKIVTVGDREGAFLVWQKDYQEFKDIQTEFEKRACYDPSEISLFQEFAIFDFLIGNIDRHEENWLVKYEDGKLKAIAPIDHAHSFVERNPTWLSFFGRRNQYKWHQLKIAQIPFTSESKKLIREHLTEENIDNLISEFKDDLKNSDEDGSFLSPDMERLFRQRVEILRKIAENDGEEYAPSDFSELRDDSAQVAFLS